MVLWKIILITYILFLASLVYAQNSSEFDALDKLILNSFHYPELSYQENKRIRQTIVRVTARQKEYIIILKNDSQKINSDFYQLDLKISRLEENNERFAFYNLVALIRTTKKEKIIKRVTLNKVKHIDLLKKSELLLEVLFGLAPSSELVIANKENLNPKKKNTKKKSVNQSAIDLQKRIRAIKEKLPKKISEIKLVEKKKEEQKDQEKEDKEKQNQEISESETSRKNKKIKKPESPLKNTNKPWVKHYYAGSEFKLTSINTIDSRNGLEDIEIATEILYLNTFGAIGLSHKNYSWLKSYLTIDIYSPMEESAELTFERLFNLAWLNNISIESYRTKLGVGLQSESTQFGTVPTRGLGKQNTTLGFTNIFYNLEFEVMKKKLILKYTYSKLISVNDNSSYSYLEDTGADQEDFEVQTTSATRQAREIKISYLNPFFLKNSYFQFSFGESHFNDSFNVSYTESYSTFSFIKYF